MRDAQCRKSASRNCRIRRAGGGRASVNIRPKISDATRDDLRRHARRMPFSVVAEISGSGTLHVHFHRPSDLRAEVHARAQRDRDADHVDDEQPARRRGRRCRDAICTRMRSRAARPLRCAPRRRHRNARSRRGAVDLVAQRAFERGFNLEFVCHDSISDSPASAASLLRPRCSSALTVPVGIDRSSPTSSQLRSSR